jgi:hypothetical protein
MQLRKCSFQVTFIFSSPLKAIAEPRASLYLYISSKPENQAQYHNVEEPTKQFITGFIQKKCKTGTANYVDETNDPRRISLLRQSRRRNTPILDPRKNLPIQDAILYPDLPLRIQRIPNSQCQKDGRTDAPTFNQRNQAPPARSWRSRDPKPKPSLLQQLCWRRRAASPGIRQ